MTLDREQFLEKNGIDKKTWRKSRCKWDVLQEIYLDHQQNQQLLSESAALYANLIQRMQGVHSVRWRIKDPDHLIEKIIRKKAENQEKYIEINVENYYEIVTDLIGIRALHLFKEDCFQINQEIRNIWSPVEKPIAYIRKGDPDDLIEKYSEYDLDVKHHPAGYRSIHYVISSQPINRKVFAEIQTRTIFEEGWSEIDHKIRYPNFSNNELIGYFLTIFNRMSGSADEMGSFVKGLASTLEDYQNQINDALTERDESLASIEELVGQLMSLKQQDSESKKTIKELQAQVTRMRSNPSIEDLLSNAKKLSEMHKYSNANSALLALNDINRLTEKLRTLKQN